MAYTRQEIPVEATADQVWAAVRDVSAVDQRLTPCLFLDTHLEGTVRTLSFPDGRVVRELIVDDDTRRLAYAVLESRLPLLHHHASL